MIQIPLVRIGAIHAGKLVLFCHEDIWGKNACPQIAPEYSLMITGMY